MGQEEVLIALEPCAKLVIELNDSQQQPYSTEAIRIPNQQ